MMRFHMTVSQSVGRLLAQFRHSANEEEHEIKLDPFWEHKLGAARSEGMDGPTFGR